MTFISTAAERGFAPLPPPTGRAVGSKNLYAKSERMTVSCRGIWASAERVNLYSRQITALRTDRHKQHVLCFSYRAFSYILYIKQQSALIKLHCNRSYNTLHQLLHVSEPLCRNMYQLCLTLSVLSDTFQCNLISADYLYRLPPSPFFGTVLDTCAFRPAPSGK